MNRVYGQPKHEFVKVSRGEIDIDVQLAPLMPLVWKLGIETFQCCQEYRPGEACIEVPSSGDAAEFLNVAQREYKVEVETFDQRDDHELFMAVRLLIFFPTKDIPLLVKRFKKAMQPSGR